VIPVLDKSTSTPEHVGVVGPVTALQAELIRSSSTEVGRTSPCFMLPASPPHGPSCVPGSSTS